MSPADKYREAIDETVYFMRCKENEDNWIYLILCEEQDRVGRYQEI